MSRTNLIIAIDGPAASGKSTTARLVADRLGYIYIDTGAMYRAVTLAVLRAGIPPADEAAVTELAARIRVELERVDGDCCVRLDGEDVSAAIRTPEVTAHVSQVSAYPGVRERMVVLQRNAATAGGVVMDGRDIGTVVFPHADLKIFMVADLHARAARRGAELVNMGRDGELQVLAAQLSERDRLDSERGVSPLRKADDAVEIDTSALTIEEQVERVVGMAREILDLGS